MKSNLAYYENVFSINRRENYVGHKNQIHFIKQVQFKLLFTLADININIHSNFNRKEFINTWINTIDNLILNYKINDPYSMYKSNFPIKNIHDLQIIFRKKMSRIKTFICFQSS